MTIDELKRKKQELGYSNEKVAEISGVPLGTVQKIFGGATKHPRYRTLQAIEAALTKGSAERTGTSCRYSMTGPDPMMLCEPQPAYGTKQQGEYTAEDYFAIPEDVRAELIEGVLYDMATPSFVHQDILRNLAFQLETCMKEHPCGCRLFFAPIGVQLDCDDRTVLEPDLIIFCDDGKMRKRVYYGAPDFVVEIVSPSNPGHDIWRKQELYRNHGVREYWVVDPRRKLVTVFPFEKEELPKTYEFEDVIPIGISNGECEVDFRKVFRRVAHFYAEKP
jgi:Uma2 family endonuclease